MAEIVRRFLSALSLRDWQGYVGKADHTPLTDLRKRREDARKLRHTLNLIIHTANQRLALPRIGSTFFLRPLGTDWSWRPALWRAPLPRSGLSDAENQSLLGDEIQLFHNCDLREITLRQLRNSRQDDLAPFALRLEVFNFNGNFMSIAANLPDAALDGLNKQHVIQLDSLIESEAPLKIFARLNIKNGPNTEQITQELHISKNQTSVAFDLADTDINEKRLEKAWLDFIFEAPEMNQIVIRDLTFTRYLRANI